MSDQSMINEEVEKLNKNMLCARIQTVFQQLLHNIGGTFDDFAGGNLIGDDFRQHANGRHTARTSDLPLKRKLHSLKKCLKN